MERAHCQTDSPTIAINDTYRLAPSAAALYACDGGWWKVHYETVRLSGFAGELWTQDEWAAKRFGLNRIGSENRPGLGLHDVIHQGGNSGYQAINLAYLWGAAQILLLGFDCGPSLRGDAHWFGQHPPTLTQHQPYEMWRAKFPALAADLTREGVRVINASRETALDCFERMSLEEAIKCLRG